LVKDNWKQKLRLVYYKIFNWAYNQIKNNIDGPVIEEDKVPRKATKRPSSGMSSKSRSSVVKQARAGKDIGKPGKGFAKVAAAAGGGAKGQRIAAAAMWKNLAKKKKK
jgi:hypothetical protein